MSAFNFIGGVIFGTIVISVIWFVIIGLADKDGDPKEKGNGLITIVFLSFIVMLILAISKCSS